MSENNDFLSLLGDGPPSRRESLDSISSRRATTPTSRPESRDRTQSKTPSDIRSEDSLWEDDEESIKDMKGFSSVDSILKRLPVSSFGWNGLFLFVLNNLESSILIENSFP